MALRRHWPPRHRWAAALLLLVIAQGASRPACAQAAAGEAELKAQVLLRVLLFVRWPADRLPDGAPMDFCVFDDTPQSQAFQVLGGQMVNGHPVRVRRLAVEQMAACHGAYVGQQAAPVLAWPHRRGVLLAGDQLGLVDEGVMLNLHAAGGRVLFDIGLASARRQELDVAVKLLRLARYVKEQ